MIFASSYNFAFLSSLASMNNQPQITSSTGGSSIINLFNLIVTVNTNFHHLKSNLIPSSSNFINIKIYDNIRSSVIKTGNIASNSSMFVSLPLGSYNVTIILNMKALFNNDLSSTSKSTFLNMPLTYSNITLLLDSNTTIVENFIYRLVTPNIANIYDFNGNGYLEYETGEYLLATINLNYVQDLLNMNYKPLWAILFFNNFAVGFSEWKSIHLFNDHLEIFIYSYPMHATTIDLKSIEYTSIYLIFWQEKINFSNKI